MTDEYEKFSTNMQRYEKEKKDREDAERWRHQEETRAASREKPKEEKPEPKVETHSVEHPFVKA